MDMTLLRGGWALGLALLAALPGAARGQDASAPVRTLTEAEVVATVVAHSPALAAARTGADAAAQGPAQVRWASPMVEAMPMLRSIRNGDPGVQFMARQPIPWPGRLGAEREARTLMASASALEAEAMELEMVAMARMAYADLWGIQEEAALLSAFGARLEFFRDAALAQYAVGRGPQQAVLAIQVEHAMLLQRLEALEEDRSGAAARLGALTGGALRPGAGDRLAPPAGAAAAGTDPGRYGNALEAHPMVAAGRAMQSAEEAMARMSRTMLRPDITLGVNLNLSRMAFEGMYDLEPVMPSVGVMIPIPRGGTKARVREAELRAAQRGLEADDALRTAEAQVADALVQLQRVRGRISAYEETLRPQARQVLDATLAGYQVGTLRAVELLDAQRMALQVELELLMARMKEAELAARLDQAAGIRWTAETGEAGAGGTGR